MKKFFIMFIIMLCLCGCEKKGPEYLVSGMGFDKVEGIYNVCFETVIINSEDTKQSVRLLKGKGTSLESAVEEILNQCTQPLLLSHCGVLVLGDTITVDELENIAKYYVKGEKITLSAFLVRTENAEKVMNIEPISSVSVGYDIMGLLEQNKEYKNRLFETVNSDYKVLLPKISIINGGLKLENR